MDDHVDGWMDGGKSFQGQWRQQSNDLEEEDEGVVKRMKMSWKMFW